MIEIRPYVRFDGIPTFRDSEIQKLFDLMERDGTDRVVFFDGSVRSAAAFTDFISQPGVILFIAMDGNIPAGFGYLTDFANRIARAHFCIFSEYWGDQSVVIGRLLLSRAMSITGLDMLLGHVPAVNQKAIDFAVRCGAQIVGTLPFGSVDADGKNHPTAVIFYVR